MKKLSTLALCACAALSVSAAEPTTIMFELKGSTEPTVCELREGYTLSFAGTPRNMLLKDGDASLESIPIGQIERITFQTPDAVHDLAADASTFALKRIIVNNTLEFVGNTPQNSQLAIWNLTGVMQLHLTAWNGEDIDITSIPAGMYIMKADQNTFKFIKK